MISAGSRASLVWALRSARQRLSCISFGARLHSPALPRHFMLRKQVNLPLSETKVTPSEYNMSNQSRVP